MKNLILNFVSLVLFSCICTGQTLISEDINFNSRSYLGDRINTIVKPNGIYFNATGDNINGVYLLDAAENIVPVVNGTLQFEYNQSILVLNRDDETIYKINPNDNIPTAFYTQSSGFIASRIIEYNDKIYFIGYSNGVYSIVALDQSGVITNQYSIPGPIHNTVRIHEDEGAIYVFSNTVFPSASHFYELDFSIGVVNTISGDEYYTQHPYPFIVHRSEVEANGEIFTIEATDGQLTSTLNPGPLTCFELIGQEATILKPTLMGNIGQNIYMGILFSIGSPNGIYRFPETANNGLCGDTINTSNVVMSFDGIDDFIEFDSPLTGDQDYTIEMWVKSQSISTGACTNSSSNNLDWILAFDDNGLGIVDCDGEFRIVFAPLCPTGNDLCSSLPAEPLDDDRWHHLAISEGSTGFRVYYDGDFLVNFSFANYDLGGTIRLGSQFGNQAGNKFKGLIDEVRIWDYIRSEQEIATSYNCEIPSNTPGLLTYFNFSEGVPNANNQTVAEVIDISGGDQNGVINNFMLLGDSSNYVLNTLFFDNECITTAVTEVKTELINIFPNPTTGIIEISNLPDITGEYIINSFTGTVVAHGELNQNSSSLDLSFLQPGPYLIYIKTKDLITAKKIIKM